MSAPSKPEARAAPPYRPPAGGFTLHHDVPPAQGSYEWVYIWQWPIRAMHWAAAVSILVLVITGFIIGPPYFLTEPQIHSKFLLGWVRFFHFAAAAVFVTTAIIRVYWLFAGNRYERLPALFPVRGRDWKNLVKMIKYYLFVHPEEAPQYVGHHPLQQFSYTGVYLVAALLVVTGFTMYGQANPGGFIWTLFHWVAPLVGGLPRVRLIHHVLTWVFLIFVPLHVYLAIRADVIERTGSISAIVSGGKWVPKHEHFADR